MTRLRSVFRLSLAISALFCTILVGLDLAGWIPSGEDELSRHRAGVAEALMTQTAFSVALDDRARIRTLFEIAVQRDEEIASLGLRGERGRLLVATREHRAGWLPMREGEEPDTQVRLPIYNDGSLWANLEVRFRPAPPRALVASVWSRPATRIVLATLVLGVLANVFLLRRVFRFLDPSSVVPTRVRTALDAMTEGVVLVDPEERVVLANTAFRDSAEESEASVVGMRLSSLQWMTEGQTPEAQALPWTVAMARGEAVEGTRLELASANASGPRTILRVSASPIQDAWQRTRGAVVSCSDVTELERNRAALEQALVELEKSQDEIRLQNEELEVLARLDPLTGLANRRTFMEWLEVRFGTSKSERTPLALVIVDIDHFKQVNDLHGHSTGDQVIQSLADALKRRSSDLDLACRYGGEEFCLALVGRSEEEVDAEIEALRAEIADEGFSATPVTASFGIASLSRRYRRPLDLIDAADKALYASKENGRDRVTRA